jgi:uncharacterized protein
VKTVIAALAVASMVAVSCDAGRVMPASEPRTEQLTLNARDATLAATLHIPGGRRGRVPAVVLVHGSGRVTAAQMAANAARPLLAMGFAVLAYDKRGVGESTGDYTGIGPRNSVAMFDLLASDALAGVETLAKRADIDPSRIGLVGTSQGGWIAPLASSRSTQVAFVVCLSGPAVTVGEENAYSRLAGADPGSLQGLSEREIERGYAAFHGPHGYDPVPVIHAMQAPSLWILGELDRSLPVKQTVANLDKIRQEAGRVWIHIVPGADHGLRVQSGERPDIWRVVAAWLKDRGLT